MPGAEQLSFRSAALPSAFVERFRELERNYQRAPATLSAEQVFCVRGAWWIELSVSGRGFGLFNRRDLESAANDLFRRVLDGDVQRGKR